MIFISHASADDKFVAKLREALENLHVPVWVDSRNLRGGRKLAPEIADAIEKAPHFIVVLSPSTVNSPWVRREITKALKVERSRKADGYRVIPLLLPGITPGALRAIEVKKPYGHAAQPWATWSILEDLERATGHGEAAQVARQQAIETYLAYRRAGGESQSNQAQLFALVAQAIEQGSEAGARQQLDAMLEPGDPQHYTALIRQTPIRPWRRPRSGPGGRF